MRLTGPQYQQLIDALLDAFRDPDQLAQMLRVRLDKNLYAIALGGSLEAIMFKVVDASQADGWTPQLIAAARESRPNNDMLLAFSQQFGLASIREPRRELEKIIKEANSFLDVAKWRRRLGEIETQVCRIEIPVGGGRMINGTGFLLGPDVVMTNYHVMEAVIEGEQGRTTRRGSQAKASDVILRFDYKRMHDSTILNDGTRYGLLAQDWLIDSSPPSTVDSLVDPRSRLPQADELDYALLRVDGTPGSDPVGGKAEPESPKRGWVEVPTEEYDFMSNPALFIMQHPQGAPLKLAIDTEAIVGPNENGTRVRYRTNTERGSSGSPCFNSNWDLVALHHSGDPSFDPDHKPTYNEGIPFSAILALLDQRGKEGVLGEQAL